MNLDLTECLRASELVGWLVDLQRATQVGQHYKNSSDVTLCRDSRWSEDDTSVSVCTESHISLTDLYHVFLCT